MTSQQMVRELQRLKNEINDNFDALYAAASSERQKQTVRDALSAARDAYYQALARGITDLNPTVQRFADDLDALNDQLSDALSDLTDFAEAMTLVTDAIKTGAAIVTLAMV